MSLNVDTKYLSNHITGEDISNIEQQVLSVQAALNTKTGAGADFLGWLNPEEVVTSEALLEISHCASRLIKISDIVLVAGIGGSYLGAKAAIDWLCSPLYNSLPGVSPQIFFIGNDLSSAHIADTFKLCEGKDVSVIVISKSGQTTETAVAFRLIRKYMSQRYGALASERIVAITDEKNGALRKIAQNEGYQTFPIPSDVGGRYSILSTVGLLPMAVAGIDIKKFYEGLLCGRNSLKTPDYSNNAALKYAALRYLLYTKGYKVELFCGWDPAFAMTNEWLKQLFGESEGKTHKALFPASAIYSTDLHSLGQFVQEGSPILFETMVMVEESDVTITIPPQEIDDDNLNYLACKELYFVNNTAQQAVCKAHFEGGVPIISLGITEKTAFTYGEMLYFFMYTCALGGYLLEVNPFDQPGVEGYKNNMFAMLGKPGYDKV